MLEVTLSGVKAKVPEFVMFVTPPAIETLPEVEIVEVPEFIVISPVLLDIVVSPLVIDTLELSTVFTHPVTVADSANLINAYPKSLRVR